MGKSEIPDEIIYFIRLILSSTRDLCTFWASRITLCTACAHSCKERKEIAVFQLKFGNYHFILGFKCMCFECMVAGRVFADEYGNLEKG